MYECVYAITSLYSLWCCYGTCKCFTCQSVFFPPLTSSSLPLPHSSSHLHHVQSLALCENNGMYLWIPFKGLILPGPAEKCDRKKWRCLASEHLMQKVDSITFHKHLVAHYRVSQVWWCGDVCHSHVQVNHILLSSNPLVASETWNWLTKRDTMKRPNCL